MNEFKGLAEDIKKIILDEVEKGLSKDIPKLQKSEDFIDNTNAKFGIKRITKKGLTP